MWAQENSFQPALICFVLKIHTQHGSTLIIFFKKGILELEKIGKTLSLPFHLTSEDLRLGKVKSLVQSHSEKHL